MMALKKYEEGQQQAVTLTYNPSGYACSEVACPGEMMVQLPIEEGYLQGRAGEPGAIKNGLVRAVCGECGWKGWVPNDA